MFCKFCGTELSDGALFCSKCGKEIANNNSMNKNDKQKFEYVSREKKWNIFCIIGIITTVLSVFENPYSLVSIAGLVFSIIGYKSSKEKNEKGEKFAIASICFCSVITLISLINIFVVGRTVTGIFELISEYMY